jgi:hypothetical protein
VAAIVVRDPPTRARTLRAAIWPEGIAAAPPPDAVAASELRILRVGVAFRESFANQATRTTRVPANSVGTRGSVAAHGFINLPAILVAALAGSDAGNLRWLGTETGSLDFMHFELAPRPALFTAGRVVDPAPPPSAWPWHSAGRRFIRGLPPR